MFWRLLKDSYLRRRRQKLLALLAVALGTVTAVTLLNVAVEIGDRVNRELKSLGANIVAMPKVDAVPLEIGGVDLAPLAEGGYLREDELPKIKTIFWRNNIIAFAPVLPVQVTIQGQRPVTLVGTWFDHEVPVDSATVFLTGVRQLNPFWQVEGAWPQEGQDQVLVGRSLAAAISASPGDRLTIEAGERQRTVTVTGILTTGGVEDRQLIAPLRVAQEISNRPGLVKRVYVSALTKPESDFSRRQLENMTPEEYDRWYCTPYPSSIALQIEEVLSGSTAKVIRQVALSEGRILSKTGTLLLIVTLAVLASAALAVASTMTSALLARQHEIALFRTLGADHRLVRWMLIVELLGVALVGGLLGWAGGTALSQAVGHLVIGTSPAFRLVLVPVAMLVATLVVIAGSWQPIQRALRMDPIQVLQRN
jgi:putative ABC transport system permease protein